MDSPICSIQVEYTKKLLDTLSNQRPNKTEETYLIQIVEVLETNLVLQVNAMVYRLAKHVRCTEVHWVPSLSSMWTKRNNIQILCLAQLIQDTQICPQVINLPCIRRVLLSFPFSWFLRR